MKGTHKNIEDTFTRNLKIRLYPNKHYIEKLEECFKARTILFNHLVEYNNSVFAGRHTYDYYYNLRREYLRIKALDKYSILTKVDSHMLRECIEDLDRGYKNYINGFKIKPPQIANSINPTCRFVEGVHINYSKNKLYLPRLEDSFLKVSTRMKNSKYGIKFKGLPTKKYRILNILQCTVFKDLIGRWYATITARVKLVKHTSPTENTVGIDVGVERLAVDSDRNAYKLLINKKLTDKYKRFIKLYLYYLHYKEYDKYIYYKNRYRKIHYKLNNIRNDFAHKLSRMYINKYKTIAVEDINLFDMVKSFCRKTSAKFKTFKTTKIMNKKILESRMGMFIACLRYKALENGNKIITVNKAYTSLACSKCGNIDNRNRKGSVFTCIKCGFKEHSDINAAFNIKQLSLKR